MATTNNGHRINDRSATNLETLTGTADDITITPANLAYMFTYLAGFLGTPGAPSLTPVATNAQAVAMTSGSVAITPSNLPSVLGWTKCYVASITQAGANPPVATILLNTMSGSITWVRNATGSYSGSLATGFTVGKTIVFGSLLESGVRNIEVIHRNVDTVTITTQTVAPPFTVTAADGLLTNHLIMIYVFP